MEEGAKGYRWCMAASWNPYEGAAGQKRVLQGTVTSRRDDWTWFSPEREREQVTERNQTEINSQNHTETSARC